MEKIKIIVASDSIGETAELVARAGISEFNPKQCKNELLDIHILNLLRC